MKGAVVLCSILLTFNLLLLDKGGKLVVSCESRDNRNFLIQIGMEK